MKLLLFLSLTLCLALCSCAETHQKMAVRITAYWKYPREDRWTAKGLSSTGAKLKEKRTVAVDPKIIPYFSEFTIQSNPPLKVIAEDTGSAVVSRKASRQTGGQPVVDIFFNHKNDAKKFISNNPAVVYALYVPKSL